MAEVTAWKNDFGKRARDKDALFASMTALINEDGATEDVEDVKKRMEDVDSLWDVLEASVTDRLQLLDDTNQRLNEFDDLLTDCKTSLSKCHEKMDAVTLDPERDAASKLDKLKGVAAELKEIGAQIQQCEALYKELIADGDTSAADLESSDMKTGLDELQQLYADKAKDLEARTEELQSGAQAVDELGENLQSMGVMVGAVEAL